MRVPTIQQAAFIDDIASGGAGAGGDVVLIARAGSGKTTTILDAVQSRPAGSSVLLCAFNKRIAEELVQRTSGWRGVTARTLHQVGLRAVNKLVRGAEIDRNRERALAEGVVGDQEDEVLITTIARLASSAKECAPDEATDVAAIERIGADLGILPDDDEIVGWPCGRILRATAEVVARSVDVAYDRRISFSDMLYVPLATRTRPDVSDIVLVDEAQDMNLAQLRLAAYCRARGGRFGAIGDDRQAIYSFRGAAPGALDRVRAALRAKTFRLTVTHRCALSIVEEARRVVPDLQAAPGAPDGIVRRTGWRAFGSSDQPSPGDFVLARQNAPLAIACLRLIRSGIRARLVGSEIGRALIVVIDKLARGGGGDLITFLERLAAWREREVAKAIARRSETGAAAARDRADTISALADDVDTTAELRSRIVDIFADDGRPHVICSSVHKAKGLEADRVWMLEDSFNAISSGGGEAPSQAAIEEDNIRYVATTRARRELIYVDGKPEGALA
jgi:DNA helicase-2/ATP-dependent DNA helicase PcrA